jgi:polar amino acid transport system substrate-binding protein
MDQLTQKLKNGAMQVLEMPAPSLGPGSLLVLNHYSLVSAGTEGNTVKTARMGFVGKAKARPQQLKQVLQTFRAQGPVQTYRAVMKKLDAYSPLGYSCTGEVLDTAPDVTGFQIGDFVACGGLTACHAELVSVPVNLCVKLPPTVDLKQAAYNSLGAIALQGVRQADLRLGETCAVIGLGLLGQLTALLLRSSGIGVVGIDIDPTMVDIAGKHSADMAFVRSEAGIEAKIDEFTAGLGCDGVIITAATDSLDPINFAGAIARKRGVIVVVGAVPTGFDREPHFYRKELQLRMSCSYGPGRYDPAYEDKGIDYPAGYVRWSENRNMQAFQELLARGTIDVNFLTTHTFRLEEAPAAYDMMMTRSEPFIGILIDYDGTPKGERQSGIVRLGNDKGCPGAVTIGFIGAGSYAQSHLLPNIPKSADVHLKGVMTATGASARSTGERFGFEFCTTSAEDILNDRSINTLFIATRHDSHAEYVKRALKAGKNVFVEKPLALRMEDLEEIREIYRRLVSGDGRSPVLMVGYNRRFSPHVQEIKKTLGNGLMAVAYRVNSGAIPKDNWIQDPELGGGRIIGEVCHFVDTITYLTGSLPVSLYAAALPDPFHLNDTVQICLKYENGSTGAVSYLSNGDKSLPKERIEVFAHGATAVIDDFKEVKIYAKGGNKRKKSLFTQDKGQNNEIRAFLDSIRTGTGGTIPFEELYSTSLVTFKILESIRRGESVSLK